MSFVDNIIKWGKTQNQTRLYLKALKGMTTAHSQQEFDEAKADAKDAFEKLSDLCGDNKEKLREINDRGWKIIND